MLTKLIKQSIYTYGSLENNINYIIFIILDQKKVTNLTDLGTCLHGIDFVATSS